MRDIDNSTGRVIALIVMLFLAAAALRGYLPAAERVSRHQETGSKAALAILVVLLGGSLGIVAVAIIGRLRNRRGVAGSIRALSEGPDGDKGQPSWRVLLIGLVVLSAWPLIIWLLQRFVGQHGFELTLVPGGHTDAPTTGTAPPPTGAAPQPGRPQPNSGGDMFRYLAAAAVGMLLLIVASIVSPRPRRGRPKPPSLGEERLDEPAVPIAEPQTLVRAAELGLAEIGDLSREPREAIIGCYATMERELAHVPDAVPQEFDTPTEVLTRAVDHHALPADNAIQLVNLFAEARFSSHLMTEQHREEAVRVLRLVLAELRSPV